MNPKVLLAATALMLTANANAVTINDAQPLTAQDRASITKLEQQLFDQLARDGVEKTLVREFPSVAGNTAALAGMQTLDKECGVAGSAERFSTKTFGSRAIREEFLVVMGSCLVKWDLTYLKVGVAWKINDIGFKSNSDEW